MSAFEPLFVPVGLLDAVSERAWLEAMLEVESALARAEAAAGVVPGDAAAKIVERCTPELFDVGALLEQGRATGNPVEPLVRRLREVVDEEAAAWVHRGATSQDVMDTAAMLVARRALDLILAELDRLAEGLAGLAEEHRSTPMVARTLLQQALPTTFGYKAAGWLVAVLEAERRLEEVQATRLAAQLGGAAGTLAALGADGAEVLRLFADELELAEPRLPWHTNRLRVAELGAALDGCAGALGKIGLDLVLLAQTEVGEVREGQGGGSSTLPHKRNPIRSTLARACATTVSGHVSVLTSSLAQEHERAAGAWHAEWAALSGALAYTGGAAAALADAVATLEVDTERMRANLDLTEGQILAERVAHLRGGADAQVAVREAMLEAEASGRPLAEALQGNERIGLSDEQIAEVLEPTTYLGSAETFVDRALADYRSERSA